MSFNVISMFSGAGGLDMGFHNKNFRILWANDLSKDACDTYDKWANYNEDGTRKEEKDCTIVECGNISKINLETIVPDKKIDVVLGGFPCQGFSLAGPRQVDDSRNILYRYFVDMVKIKKPKVFVAENVIGIKTLGKGIVFNKIIEDFSELGYTVSAPTINAKNFGVPQDRMRVIFIGIQNSICHKGAYIFPSGNLDIVTLEDALREIEIPKPEEVCQAAFSSRYMSRNRKRNYNDVSFTIPAMAKQVPLSPDSEGMEYYDVDEFRFIGENNRRLSYKEAAAIQTFPKDMVFCGSLDSKYKQIGNAVPVKLAEVIATEVYKILTEKDLTPYLNMENPEHEIRADRRITSKVITGKAFEYATLMQIHRELRQNGWDAEKIKIIEDQNFSNVQRAYEMMENQEEGADYISFEVEQNDYDRAARVAAKYLVTVEPALQENKDFFAKLKVMSDRAGVKGDVRDVNILLYKFPDLKDEIKTIGISCKNNHEAVKHPRITENPDFIKEWTNGEFECSKKFMEGMSIIFEKIDEYALKYKKWTFVEDKQEKIYYPIIQLFVQEIKEKGIILEDSNEEKKDNAKRFTKLFFEYMFGKQDFYKFIKEDKSKMTKVYPYNLNGTLMKPYKNKKNEQGVQSISAPQEIVQVRIKPKSKTTIEIFFDQWIISMRLHNADSKITRTSLKFDVQIKAQPRKIMGTMLYWENNKKKD